MAVEKRVLLARPHAFIVNQMRPFLLEAGYTPVGAQSVEHLAQELRGTFHGAIISTAVSSTVDADAATVGAVEHRGDERLGRERGHAKFNG